MRIAPIKLLFWDRSSLLEQLRLVTCSNLGMELPLPKTLSNKKKKENVKQDLVRFWFSFSKHVFSNDSINVTLLSSLFSRISKENSENKDFVVFSLFLVNS